jgi:hypothetical protein
MYTVQKYAIKQGYVNPENATPYFLKRKISPKKRQEKPVLTKTEERNMWRKKWRRLIADNPDANRTLLKTLDAPSYLWLQGNDSAWFEKHLPAAQRTVQTNWGLRDIECLKLIQEAAEDLYNTPGKPVWVSFNRIALQTKLNTIRNQESLEKMPKTAAFLQENAESIDQWRKRKIIWAIRQLREADKTVTPHQVAFKATISIEVALGLQDFMLKCLEQEELQQKS